MKIYECKLCNILTRLKTDLIATKIPGNIKKKWK